MNKEIERKYINEINRNPIVFKDIKNPSYELCREAIKREPVLIKFIDNPSEEICEIAISKKPYTLAHIKNPSKRACLLAVRQNGFAIELINNPDEDICIEAISREANSIVFIKNQTIKLCKIAIKKDGSSLRYIKKDILSDKEHIMKEFKDITMFINKIDGKWLFSCISSNKLFRNLNNLCSEEMATFLEKYKLHIEDYDTIINYLESHIECISKA